MNDEAVARVRVIGCGNPDAGDDAAGLLAVRAARKALPRDIDVVEAGSGLRVLDLLEDADALVLVDAVRDPGGQNAPAARAPGTMVRADHVELLGGLPGGLRTSLSSHGLGLAEAIALATTQGPLPPMVFLGLVADGAVMGAGLSPAVAGALPVLVDRIVAEAEDLAAARSSPEARRLDVTGVVQGVGFRPFIWRLAGEHGITGWVRNRGGVVEIHAEGTPGALRAFTAAVTSDAPPLARVDEVRTRPAETEHAPAFRVDRSTDDAPGDRLVSPDAATCPACLAELFDPTDRRYRYPFINCTDCGPRFTIIDDLPYDRERTSMRAFALCPACRREYEDPADRRFHAEPVACPECGPRLTYVDGGVVGDMASGDPIARAATILAAGGIVALKGLGGFHLACDATDDAAVGRLRERKRRPDKPFAVMVRGLDAARQWFEPSADDEAALAFWRAPIVLVRERGRLAPAVAPGFHRHGAMLPATPLHHLLLRATDRPLVMTSGNASDEPICITNAEALGRLGAIADAFVLHDRDIVTRYDDSVVAVRTGEGIPSVVRRARSLAPSPITLPGRGARVPTLGVGAELHGAFCLASGRRAYLSQHIGDLDSEEAMTAYRVAYDRYRRLFRIEPELIAHDLHPDFLTTRFAEESGLPRVAVQHHHAHIATTMAEHGLEGEVLGIAFDGMGFGADGSIWGGEFLRAGAAGYQRLGRLRPVRQPGGDAATRQPWRMAIAHALDAGAPDEMAARLAPGEVASVVLGQLRSGLASPWTTSAGRLFDAVAAILGICGDATYEGQPAMLLEQAASPGQAPHDVGVERIGDLWEIDTRDLIAAVLEALPRDPRDAVAGRFHSSLAAVTARACAMIRDDTGLERVVLGGGVFYNDLLTADLARKLTADGFKVFCPHEVPVGDGGIALGQVLVAAAQEGG